MFAIIAIYTHKITFKSLRSQARSRCFYVVGIRVVGIAIAMSLFTSPLYAASTLEVERLSTDEHSSFYKSQDTDYVDDSDDSDDIDDFEISNEVDDFNDYDETYLDEVNSNDGTQIFTNVRPLDSSVTRTTINIIEKPQDPQADGNLNDFERQKLQDTLDDNLIVKNVPLNAVSPETLKTFVQVIDLVRRDYVEPVSDEVLFHDAIAGMLEKLDPHAEFLDAEAYDNLRAFTEGDVGHVGIEVEFEPTVSQWVIKQVALSSPAQQAGLQEGDYLHKINNIGLNAGMHEADITQLLSGIAGTQVDVEVSHAGRDKRIVTLQRNIAERKKLEVEVIGSVAYIKLPVFQNDTAIQMIEALDIRDTPITGVLIDIRNNPGGVLTSAVEVASLFMDNTDVVQIRGRKTPLKVLSTQGTPILKDLPLVILQNRYSASASEVLASSLQINNRALITGERSYGKGSIQAILPLDEEQAVKMTVAHYFGADGSEIDGKGVTPDIALPDNSMSLWKQQALAILLEQDRPLGIVFNTTEDGIAVEESY